jgi:hypothetical protein
MSPARIASCSARWLGSKRRLNATKNGTPVESSTLAHASTRARSRSTGFSQNIALPARAARSMIAACVRGGCRSSPRRPRDRQARRRASRWPWLRASRELGRNVPVEIDDPGELRAGCAAMFAAWSGPMKPPPTRQKSIIGVGQSVSARSTPPCADDEAGAFRGVLQVRESHARIGQRMRRCRILLGLDDEPSVVSERHQFAQHGREIDRAVARHREDAVEDRAQEAAIVAITSAAIADARPCSGRARCGAVPAGDAHRIAAGEDEVPVSSSSPTSSCVFAISRSISASVCTTVPMW